MRNKAPRGVPSPEGATKKSSKIPAAREPHPLDVLDLNVLAENAIHHLDPLYRKRMAFETIHLLDQTGLPAPVQRWLAFVLRSLLREDRIPSLARGRPIDSVTPMQRAFELWRFLDEQVGLPVDKALGRAEVKLGPWARRLYYAEPFAKWRQSLDRERRWRRATPRRKSR